MVARAGAVRSGEDNDVQAVKLYSFNDKNGKVISFALFFNEMVHPYETDKIHPFLFRTSLQEN